MHALRHGCVSPDRFRGARAAPERDAIHVGGRDDPESVHAQDPEQGRGPAHVSGDADSAERPRGTPLHRRATGGPDSGTGSGRGSHLRRPGAQRLPERIPDADGDPRFLVG